MSTPQPGIQAPRASLGRYLEFTAIPDRAEADTLGLLAGLDESSFVAVQQWGHDFDRFEAMDQGERDHIIGRRLRDNEERDDGALALAAIGG